MSVNGKSESSDYCDVASSIRKDLLAIIRIAAELQENLAARQAQRDPATALTQSWSNPASPYCSTEEAARYLGRSAGTIRRWIAKGILRKHRPAASGTRGPTSLLKADVAALAQRRDG